MKSHHYLILAIVGLCIAVLYGCAATASVLGLATKDDIKAEHEDQRQTDHAIVQRERDVQEGRMTPTDAENDLNAVIEKSSERSLIRTAPPPVPVPASPTDWPGIAGMVLGVLAAAGAAYTHRSLGQTDDWVQETENKVHANTVTNAVIASRVGVVPEQPVQHTS